MSTISIELNEERLQRLRQIARDRNQTPDDTAATLMEEGLRAREFPCSIHFRDTDTGHQAMVPGIRVPVYFLAQLAREVNEDIQTISEHYSIHANAVVVSLTIFVCSLKITRDIVEHGAAEARLLATLPADNIITVPIQRRRFSPAAASPRLAAARRDRDHMRGPFHHARFPPRGWQPASAAELTARLLAFVSRAASARWRSPDAPRSTARTRPARPASPTPPR